mgnify:CR=1 FL=1
MSREKVIRGRRAIPVSAFKAHCLRLLKELDAGAELVVTHRGTPLAVVRPAPGERKRLANRWADTVEIVGDIVSPLLEEWKVH